MEQYYSALTWRSIGPHRGGRSIAVAGHPQDPMTFYFGSAGGGIWKSSNGGLTWANISDGYLTSASVGALAVAPSDPNVIYAGMGEACIRGNVSYGDGVYRSTDGGLSWRHLGLTDTRHIARVRVHPTNPDWVYVAALGHAFGPNRERGIFRSRDGGTTWEHVLERGDSAGAADLVMDPANPRILFASLWQARRSPWSLVSGGEHSGLFRSTDGGDSWTEVSTRSGFPTGPWGRIGVAASAARPGRIWAIVEAQDGGVYRSEDYGLTWKRLSEEHGLRARAWYYSHIFADPADADTVYVLNMGFFKSVDGGQQFQLVGTPHGDHHDLWIDPTSPSRMIHGADGGAAVSFDGGQSWSSIYNQPTGEFYHVTTDSRFPYRVYGAQQDNTTLSVPSANLHGALSQREWYDVGGAESGYIAVRPDDPDIVFAGSSGGGEGGRITRYNHRTGQQRDVSPWPERTAGMAASEYTYRFQWTSPIVLSPHDPHVLYVAGNHIFRSRDEGVHWEKVSPDLSRNDPTKLGPSGGSITLDHTGVEVYCTVFSLAESPVQPGLLWAGTDDGLIHVSTDSGQSWANVTPALLPEWSLVSIIEPSAFEAGTAYVAATRYKHDDGRPFLLKTRDFGRTWDLIVEGIPDGHFTRVIREDPKRQGLLYAGTERGVYVSWDAGASWHTLNLNLPLVPIHDLVVHENDLVLATHGRAFWILDDLSPLRQIPETPGTDAHLFRPGKAVRLPAGGGFFLAKEQSLERPVPVMEWPTGASFYVKTRTGPDQSAVLMDAGQNRTRGAFLYYYLPAPVQHLALTIRDQAGGELRHWASDDDQQAKGEPKLDCGSGTHRFVWNLTLAPAEKLESGPGEPGEDPLAPMVLPGVYQARLIIDGATSLETLVTVVADPRSEASPDDLQAQLDFLSAVRDEVSSVHRTVNRLRRQRQDLDRWIALAATAERWATLGERLQTAREALTEIERDLVQVEHKTPLHDLHYAAKLNGQLAYLFAVAASADARPTSATEEAFTRLREAAHERLDRYRQIAEQDLPSLVQAIADEGLPLIG